MEVIIAPLKEDLEYVSEVLLQFETYCLSDDIQQRMDGLGLSSVSLAERCRVSHTIVDRWRTGKARPNGKERLKELGMALMMDSDALNEFLFHNGYPKLYLRNPLDSAARMLLLCNSGRPDIVDIYRELVERLGLSRLTTVDEEILLATAIMSRELKHAGEEGRISQWFRVYKGQLSGDGKTQHPDLRLGRFLLLYIGDTTIHEMAVAGELPIYLRNLLYPLVAGKRVTVRFLREKLIAFGLYTNMTEPEIDVMLQHARLRPLSEPSTALDMAILSALRCAHERYPLYEYENLHRIIKRLSLSNDEEDRKLLEQYILQEKIVKKMVDYYVNHEHTAEERAFERHYTSLEDKSVMDYVYDLLCGLMEEGLLEKRDTERFLNLLKRS